MTPADDDWIALLTSHLDRLTAGDLGPAPPALGAPIAQALDRLTAAFEQQRAGGLEIYTAILAGIVHHERSPLSSLACLCESMFDADPPAPALRDEARHQLREMSSHLDTLSRFAQSAAEPRLLLTPVSPRALALRIVADHRSQRRFAGVTFEAAGDATDLLLDEPIVAHALAGLVANGAAACMNLGDGGLVEVSVQDRDAGVAIAVSDRGVGLAAADLARLLRPSFHSTRRTTGIGLGIPFAQHAAALHAGHLDARSAPGRGSTISMWLPRIQTPIIA